MTLTFKQFLAEHLAPIGKLTHLEHPEDRIFHGGEDFHHSMNMLHAVHHRMQGLSTTPVKIKYDGSPSLVFGTHPKTGKFFVGTKAALSKTPTLSHTAADVE
ncbi:MAG: DUF6267 family protein, partial [Candidatus Dormibacteria bacterium]